MSALGAGARRKVATRIALLAARLGLGLLINCGLCQLSVARADEFSPESPFAPWKDLQSRLRADGIEIDVLEQSEVWGNVVGGLTTGAVYNGLTTPSLSLDLNKLVGWEGAKIFVSAYQIHGRAPSSALVGNQQLLSNIEATASTKLYMLWLEQQLFGDALNIRIGQEGANDEMMLAPSAALFLNSSFGYPDLLSQDLPSGGPNYPLATPMVRVQVKASKEVTLVTTVFNGDPAGPGPGDPQVRDASGTAFRLQDPALSFGEIWYSLGQDKNDSNLPGIYKLGVWYHAGTFDDQSRDTSRLSLADPLSNGVAREHQGDYAIYGIANQMIWRKSGTQDEGINIFALGMVAPSDRNRESAFIQGGVTWKAPFAGRPDDTLGVAVACAITSPSLINLGREEVAFSGKGATHASNETVVEATYFYKFSERVSLQPDLQVVVNPGAALNHSGTAMPKDSLILGLRTTIDF
jgi:porin